MGAVGLGEENDCPEVPRGLRWQPIYGCDGLLQAYLRREVDDFEIVDKECVKPDFSDTPLIRAIVRLSRCAAGLDCFAVLNACSCVVASEGAGVARSRGGAVAYLGNQVIAVLI
jgi:hypothetical protein